MNINTTNLPFYKTRKFWAILLSSQLSISVLTCYMYLFPLIKSSEILNFFYNVAIGSGLFFYHYIIGQLLTIQNSYFIMVFMITAVSFCIYKTFFTKPLKIIYPIYLSLTSLLSMALIFILAGSFN